MKNLRRLLAFALLARPALGAEPVTTPPSAAVPPPSPAPTPENTPARPLRLAFDEASAIGVTHAKFFNQLVGARLDYRFTPRWAFGGELSYANLKGKDRRVSNVLPEVTTEYRIPLSGEHVGLPVRASFGFLPKNGPTMRLGAGVDFAAAEAVSFELVPLEPMLWITRDRQEVSFDAHVALRLAF
jgi:hypothetical protein